MVWLYSGREIIEWMDYHAEDWRQKQENHPRRDNNNEVQNFFFGGLTIFDLKKMQIEKCVTAFSIMQR